MVQTVFRELEEISNLSLIQTMGLEVDYENPVYEKRIFDVGQSFETLLLSIKIQDHHDFQYSHVKYSTPDGDIELPSGILQWYGKDLLWTNEFNGIDSPSLIVLTNASWFNISSGKGNGVEITVDLETFNNADISQEGDGLSVILEDNDNLANFDLRGFTVQPGELATIQIFPSLYDITPASLDRFDYTQRKCVGENEIELTQLSQQGGDSLPLNYTLTNCLKSAMMTELIRNCPGFIQAYINPGTDSFLSGNLMDCTREYMNQIGRWKIDEKSGKQCFPTCKRQENELAISTLRFPNSEFQKSPEFLTIAKKLFWSCHPNTTRFGYKRRMLSLAFPGLCLYYDQHFYPQPRLAVSLAAEDALLRQYFNWSSALAVMLNDGEEETQGPYQNITSMNQIQVSLKSY